MGGVQPGGRFLTGMAVGVFCVGILLPASITLFLIRKAEQKILGI